MVSNLNIKEFIFTKNTAKSPIRHRNLHNNYFIHSKYKDFFSFGTFDSFLASLGQNRDQGACCFAYKVHKPV